MIRIISLALVMLLAGCVSTYMSQYVGKDIREVMMMEGQPVNTFDMPNGRRAYQYIFGKVIGSTAGTRVTEMTYKPSVGDAAKAKATTTEQASATYKTRGCLVTYIARRQGDAWIVEEYRYPSRLVC